MKIEARFHCGDVIGSPRDGVYTLPDGASVGAVLAAAYHEMGRGMEPGIENSLTFLINGRAAAWDDPLSDGETLRVLFKIMGG